MFKKIGITTVVTFCIFLQFGCVYNVAFVERQRFAPFVQTPPAGTDGDSGGSMPVWDSIYFHNNRIAEEYTRKIVAIRGEVMRVVPGADGDIYQLRMLSEGKDTLWMRIHFQDPIWFPSKGQTIRVLGFWREQFEENANQQFSSDKYRVLSFCLYNESTDQIMIAKERSETCEEWIKGTHGFRIYRKAWE